MSARRSVVVICTLFTLIGTWAPSALAHLGSMDNPSGPLMIPAGGSTSIPINQSVAGDTIQWTWSVALVPPEKLSTQVIWVDSLGQEHALAPDPPGRTFGTFVAPETLRGARLVWRNAGEVAAVGQWSYGASAPFWSRPNIYLPALIPVFLLIACYALAKVVDGRVHRRSHATIQSEVLS
jgi:hypothetical protein